MQEMPNLPEAPCLCFDADLLAAAEKVLAGLNARIDVAPSTAKPVFDGIADLHDAINKARRRRIGEEND